MMWNSIWIKKKKKILIYLNEGIFAPKKIPHTHIIDGCVYVIVHFCPD